MGGPRKYEGNTIGNRIYFPSRAGSVVTPPSSFPFLPLPLILLNGPDLTHSFQFFS